MKVAYLSEAIVKFPKLFILLTILFSPLSVNANLITNGSFEIPAIPEGTYQHYALGSPWQLVTGVYAVENAPDNGSWGCNATDGENNLWLGYTGG